MKIPCKIAGSPEINLYGDDNRITILDKKRAGGYESILLRHQGSVTAEYTFSEPSDDSCTAPAVRAEITWVEESVTWNVKKIVGQHGDNREPVVVRNTDFAIKA